MQIGEEFCGSDSAEIQSSIKDQSRHYFQKYHLSRLEELRLFLENEAWTPCPVKPNFNLLHLQVWIFRKQTVDGFILDCLEMYLGIVFRKQMQKR